jgi:hypothetical protein
MYFPKSPGPFSAFSNTSGLFLFFFYKIPVVVPDSLVKHLFFMIKYRVSFLVSIE